MGVFVLGGLTGDEGADFVLLVGGGSAGVGDSFRFLRDDVEDGSFDATVEGAERSSRSARADGHHELRMTLSYLLSEPSSSCWMLVLVSRES